MKLRGGYMKYTLLILLFFLSFVQAQKHFDSDDYVKMQLNLSLWPGLSMGDFWAEDAGYKKIYNNGLAFSLVGMKAARLQGLDLSGGFSIYTEGIKGLQVSGLFSLINGNIKGAQGAGIFSFVNGNIKGLQTNGIFTIHNGSFKGGQASGVFTIHNGSFQGVQGNGVFNIHHGNFSGLQANGVFNLQAGDFTGGQYNGVFGLTIGSFRGAQISSVFNITLDSFRGLQFSPFFNYATYFDGGLQVGLVNIAQSHEGVPIGLLTIVRDVPFKYTISYNDHNFVGFTLRSGSYEWYNNLTVAKKVEGADKYHAIGGGFGRHFRLGYGWGLDSGLEAFKLLNKNLKDEKIGWLANYHLLFHYELRGEGALFFGPTVNFWTSKSPNENFSQNSWVNEEEEGHYFKIWPGFKAGIKL